MPRLHTLFAMFIAFPAIAAEPLHLRIDRLIEAKAQVDGIPISPLADDAEFLRRVSLDLVGRIPTVDATRAFLSNTSPDKRVQLIEVLLGGPDYAPRMADVTHLMLMERLGDHAGWLAYLRESFANNKPWDQMVRQMLRADPKDEKNKAAAFFLSKRLENYGQNPVDYSGLTRDVGRLFLGKNYQCNECHDHLFVEDYKQQHFQGLHTFFKNTVLVDAATPEVGEKPITEKTTFMSVFTKVEMKTAPALPDGKMLEFPIFAKGQEFLEPPVRGKKGLGVPKFSTLNAVSEQLPTASNRDFVRNAVNRFWFVLLGRGLVHPLDMHHSGNDASHPELLDVLAREFVAHKFDVKYLLREIALSKTYQRSSLLPKGASEPPPPQYFATAIEKRLSAEQLFASVQQSTGAKFDAATRTKFVKTYANQPREPEEEVEPSLKAALFLLHDASILGLTKPRPGTIAERVVKLPPTAVADELYLTILSRRPTADESATVTGVLARHGDQKAEAVGMLAWALLASMEFGVNH